MPHEPHIDQVEVFSQTDSDDLLLRRDGCGINTFKNALLSLLLAKKSITQTQFNDLSKSKELIATIYAAVKDTIAKRDADGVIQTGHRAAIDVTMPKLFEMVSMAQNGLIDMTAHGITQDMLHGLRLEMDGTQDVTIANTAGFADFGHTGTEEDLLAASTIAKLARTKGAHTHAFAVGFNDAGHWMTAVLHQDEHGERSWEFMDSYRNQATYKKSIINKMDTILNKSAPELRQYLITAYRNAPDLVQRRFDDFFDPFTNLPLDGVEIDMTAGSQVRTMRTAKGYFVDDARSRTQFIGYIVNRFMFMENAGWLAKGLNDQELTNLTVLHAVTKFMVDNGADAHPAIKAKLVPIEARLKAALNAQKEVEVVAEVVAAVEVPDPSGKVIEPKKKDDVVAQLEAAEVLAVDAPDKVIEPKRKDEVVAQLDIAEVVAVDATREVVQEPTVIASTSAKVDGLMTVAAIDAVENREPVATPSLGRRFVNAIANILRGAYNAVADFFESVAIKIGIKAQ